MDLILDHHDRSLVTPVENEMTMMMNFIRKTCILSLFFRNYTEENQIQGKMQPLG